jgi:hypothetical protein
VKLLGRCFDSLVEGNESIGHPETGWCGILEGCDHDNEGQQHMGHGDQVGDADL